MTHLEKRVARIRAICEELGVAPVRETQNLLGHGRRRHEPWRYVLEEQRAREGGTFLTGVRSRDHAEKLVASRLDSLPVALWDLDEEEDVPIFEGDRVRFEGRELFVQWHDYEGYEGQPMRVLYLNSKAELPQGQLQPEFEKVPEDEVELIERHADRVPLPVRLPVVAMRTIVVFGGEAVPLR